MPDQSVARVDPASPNLTHAIETDLIELASVDALEPNSLATDHDSVRLQYPCSSGQCLRARRSAACDGYRKYACSNGRSHPVFLAVSGCIRQRWPITVPSVARISP